MLSIWVLLCILSQTSSDSFNFGPMLSEVISSHFGGYNGAHLYFCRAKDAISVLKNLSKKNDAFNGEILNSNTSNSAVQITLKQPQVMSVFLDLTCTHGVIFLSQCTNLFNSSYRWLLLSDDYNNTLELLKPTRLSADSDVSMAVSEQDDVILFDIYRMHETLQFRVTDTMLWKGDRVVRMNIPPSRENFEGIKIGAMLMLSTTLIDLVFAAVTEDECDVTLLATVLFLKTSEVKFKESVLNGSLLDRSFDIGIDDSYRYALAIFLHLSEMCNYSYSFILNEERSADLDQGICNGMVSCMQKGEAELGLAPVKFIVEATEHVDYITSIYTVRSCFTFLQPKMFGNDRALIHPLDSSVWSCLLIIILIAVLMFRVVALHEGNTVHNDSWGGSALMVFAAISQQGLPDSSERIYTRLIYLSLLIISFFTVAYYNTAILNGLLLQAPYSIHNIDQLLYSDMQFGALDKHLLRDELEKNDSITQKVRAKLEDTESPRGNFFSIIDGVKKIKEGHFALFTRDQDIYTKLLDELSDAEICSMSEVEMSNPYHAGAISKDNGPYKEIFNRKFSLMRERGVMNRQRRYWQEPKPECHWRQDLLVLGAGPLLLAFLVVIIGSVAAVMIFLLEIALYSININKSRMPEKKTL